MYQNEKTYYNLIRHNIKRYREKAGLTQQQLADKAGLSMNYIAKIESTKMQRSFTIATLGKIAEALGVDIKDLFEQMEVEV